jgi:hypothetical protein
VAAVDEQAMMEHGTTGRCTMIGITIVDRPEDLVGRVDGVMEESIDGRLHRERALPFIDVWIPIYMV